MVDLSLKSLMVHVARKLLIPVIEWNSTFCPMLNLYVLCPRVIWLNNKRSQQESANGTFHMNHKHLLIFRVSRSRLDSMVEDQQIGVTRCWSAEDGLWAFEQGKRDVMHGRFRRLSSGGVGHRLCPFSCHWQISLGFTDGWTINFFHSSAAWVPAAWTHCICVCIEVDKNSTRVTF